MKMTTLSLLTLLVLTACASPPVDQTPNVPSYEDPPDVTPDGLVRVSDSVFDLAYVKPDLDFDRYKRIQIKPRDVAGPITSPSFVSKGIGFRPRREGLEIVKVFADTPAAAGLREGDLVTSIDGTPVYERSCADPYGPPEGTRLRISYLRDGAAAEVEIRTVALIP